MHSAYEDGESLEFVNLSKDYEKMCTTNNVKQTSRAMLGRIISMVFPQATSRNRRNRENNNQFETTYTRIKYRDKDILLSLHNPSSNISNYLLPDMFIMESNSLYVKVGYKSSYQCQGHNVLIELILRKNLEIEIIMGDKHINPLEVGIWKKLPYLSVNNIRALMLCIKGLRLCIGKPSASKNVKRNATYVQWCVNGTLHAHIQSKKCKGFLTMTGSSNLCSTCLNLFYEPKQKQPMPSTTPSAASMPSSTPDKATHCDANVGTTPLKTTNDVLLKFFPHLKQQTNLLTLLSEQIQLAAKDPRGRRYEKDLICLSLSLFTKSPRNYEELLKAGFILPSVSLLKLYKNCVQQKSGFNSDMFKWMRHEADNLKLDSQGFVGGLVLDEMNIERDLQVTDKGGQWTLIGFPDLGDASNAMSSLSSNKSNLHLADHVLQFVFHGMTGFRMPFACFPTSQANSSDLYYLIFEAIDHLLHWGFTVEYVSLDGSANNRATVKMLFDDDPICNNATVDFLCDPSKKFSIIPDPSHVFKKIRNAVFSSGTETRHTRRLMLNGCPIEWKHWEKAYEWNINRDFNPVSPHPHLPKDAIYLSDPNKMRNFYAEQALNENMLFLMEAFNLSSPGLQLSGTIAFLKQTSILLNNFRHKSPIVSKSDERLQQNKDILKWFQQWDREAKCAKKLMSRECREDLYWMLVGFEAFVNRMVSQGIPVSPCDINSDIIENFFSSQRGIQGGSKTNPPMHSYLYNVTSIVIGQSIVSTKSNTGGQGKAAEPYKFSTPGPLQSNRNKRRKLSYESPVSSINHDDIQGNNNFTVLNSNKLCNV